MEGSGGSDSERRGLDPALAAPAVGRDGICRGAGFGAEERTSKPPCPGCSHFLCSPSYNLFHIAAPGRPLPPLAASRLRSLPLHQGCGLSAFCPEKKKKKKGNFFKSRAGEIAFLVAILGWLLLQSHRPSVQSCACAGTSPGEIPED